MKDKALRDHSYDIAKGLGIIMVVFGHTERGLSISGMPTHFSLMGFIDYTIYTFHMPFFSSCLDFFSPKKMSTRQIFLPNSERISLTLICSGQFCMAV